AGDGGLQGVALLIDDGQAFGSVETRPDDPGGSGLSRADLDLYLEVRALLRRQRPARNRNRVRCRSRQDLDRPAGIDQTAADATDSARLHVLRIVDLDTQLDDAGVVILAHIDDLDRSAILT